MIFILATLTPVMEEHTKLISHLSEPSSQLIHCIAHPSEEEISAKVNTCCFIFMVLHHATIISAEGFFSSRILPSTCLGSKAHIYVGWHTWSVHIFYGCWLDLS